MSAAQYARLVSRKYRGPKLPKINRPRRPRLLAWAGPAAFYPNRFYEQDKWYKARIDKPDLIPQLHIIDPTLYGESLAEYLQKEKVEPTNIGFAKKDEKRIPKISSDTQLEKLSRTKKLRIDMSRVGEADQRVIAHFGVFEHLFNDNVYFDRTQNFEVSFGDHGVHTGNILWAEDTKKSPQVSIESVGADGFNTIVAVNLDGNASEQSGEILHWLVANIPDGKSVSEGEEKAKWIQALPFLGTGFHRLTFLLLRHSEKIDVTDFNSDLGSRVFSTAQFYKKHEEKVTPSALNFANVAYDVSVKEALHAENLQSPLYEYEWNERMKRDQKEFPLKPMPFDLYFDQFRDPKDVQADLLRERFKKVSIDDVTPPKFLDDNYVENKKKLDAWNHAKLLEKNKPDSPVYNNSLKY
ncbi:mrpl-38 [Pristionchus pacificus]|uniref:Large ribosomal subunit protein mL38 n=1 Tax=Pristionchus pacificus TaxID=54126 RepID=A0A2A6BKL3_PRIPA|nr:mrpl-38 [Pristionchus pacificus]|eukprot:PDM66454.1 mrpl-38 [Pristionchus pacificus]